MKDLEKKFVEIEKRVQALVTKNKSLKDRVSELEQQLVQARSEALKTEHFHGKQLHIKEKIELILHSLENARNKD